MTKVDLNQQKVSKILNLIRKNVDKICIAYGTQVIYWSIDIYTQTYIDNQN